MSFYNLTEGDQDQGLLVVGAGIDLPFRYQADAAGHTTEKLADTSPEAELDPRNLRAAAMTLYAAELAEQQVA